MNRLARSVASELVGTALRWSNRRAGIALVYHGLGQTAEQSAEVLVPPVGIDTFERQLAHLIKRYRLVPASGLLEAALARSRGDRFPVAITFDDDLRSHADLAAPALRRASAPATFFLCGNSLWEPAPFWWEQLQYAYDGGKVPASIMERAGARSLGDLASWIEHQDPGTQADVSASLRQATGGDPPDIGLSAEAVRGLADAGFEVGFHTRGHYRLMPLSDDALRTALSEGVDDLERVLGRSLDVIAYPHGGADGTVASAAERAGFRAGFTSAVEPVTAESSPLLMGRVEPTRAGHDVFRWQVVSTLAQLPPRHRIRHVTATVLPRRLREGLRNRVLHVWPPRGAARLAVPWRRTPVSRDFGTERGKPIDRYYIESFLETFGQRGGAISGHVMEIGDDTYARAFASSPGAVTRVDILDIDGNNPKATIVADLVSTGVPNDIFDCIICTQTLLLIYDVRAAVREIYRMLRPGGVALITVPGISQVCRPGVRSFVDYWRFTDASLRRLLEEVFPAPAIDVVTYGNVLTATAFLQGLSLPELRRAELDVHDDDYQLIIGARARKPLAPEPQAGLSSPSSQAGDSPTG